MPFFRGYLLFMAFFIWPVVWAGTASAQKKPTVVNLISSTKTIGTKDKKGADYLKVYNGVFRQDNSTLRSDSAYFYPQNNSFEAFSNVNINQGDTLNIYSDLLNYNGNTKVALLTNNVRLVDRDATLSTNYLTYNTATRIGTYTGGGRLVNKDNVLTSKNGYYFANSRDSYFRYDVVLTSPDALIKTDTMRYNTGSKVAFFYGPTNIYGKDDTLYTENGRYDTQVQQAFFGKKNKYRQGTKTLNGDSLFYDRLRGYGRAVRNVTFNDREQNITLKGDLATNYKSPDRTIVTQNAYVVIVTEDDSAKKTPAKKAPPLKADEKRSSGKAENDQKTPAKKASLKTPAADTTKPKTDTIYLTADTLETRIFTLGELKQLRETQRLAAEAKAKIARLNVKDTSASARVRSAMQRGRARADSLQSGNQNTQPKNPAQNQANNITRKAANTRDPVPAPKNTRADTALAKGKNLPAAPEKTSGKEAPVTRAVAVLAKQPQKPRTDSVPAKKPIVYVKQERRTLQLKSPAAWKIPLYALTEKVARPETPQSEEAKKQLAAREARRRARANADSLSVGKDLIPQASPELTMKDTARVRIIMAYHHAKVFKKDVQAKADSMFFSNSDSTMRCYINPIFWAEGSQLTADTIHFQLKSKKIDNMDMFTNAFVVNTEKDSANFNQVAGRKMKGYFLNGKLNRLYVDGNAESIYYAKDSTGYQGMNRSSSSRIKVTFAGNKAQRITFLLKPEQIYYPMDEIPADQNRLKGFIWKPEERPVSKESIIPSLATGTKRQKTPIKKASPANLPKQLMPAAGNLLKDKKTPFAIPPFMLP